MNNPYDLNYSSKLYREEALREATKRHLVDLKRAGRERSSGLGRLGLRWTRLQSLLRNPEISGQPTEYDHKGMRGARSARR